jgi:hypothetical protein
MFIYQTKKRELYYERVIALYQQTGYGKKRLGKLFPEIGEKTISRWIANFVSENPQVASMNERNQHEQPLFKRRKFNLKSFRRMSRNSRPN